MVVVDSDMDNLHVERIPLVGIIYRGYIDVCAIHTSTHNVMYIF
jgi:hypothetical protein